MRCRIRGASATAIIAAALAAGSLGAQDRIDPPAISLQISERHADRRPRVDMAVKEAAARLGEWLGPAARPSLTINDDPAWRSVHETMAVESAVVYELARQWVTPAERSGDPVVHGIAWYLQSRIVEQLYDLAFLHPGHSSVALSFFGGQVAYPVPTLRLGRFTAGLGRYGDEAAWPHSARTLPSSLDRSARRVAMALASLERSIGWPAMQGGLFESAKRLRAAPLSIEALGVVLSDATGRDATRVLTSYQNPGTVDYAITGVAAQSCESGNCVITTVSVEGSGAAPEPLLLRVEFADGQRVDTWWDGSASRTFDFEAPVGWAGAHLDPDRVHLLDDNLLNNDRLARPQSNVAIDKWTARWLVWLQDVVLTYSGIV